MSEHDPNTVTPQVRDRRPTIAGLLPKNAQNRVLGGIALLMVLVIMFSGRKGAAPKTSGAVSPAAMAVDPSTARIQEYRSRLDEQTQKLAAEEARLTQTQHALGVTPRPAAGVGPSSPASPTWSSPPAAYRPEPERNWMDVDREKREYQSLYASNVVLSYRQSPDDRLSAAVGAVSSERSQTGGAVSKRPATGLDTGAGRTYRLFEGTVIETVLTNRLDSSLSRTRQLHGHDKRLFAGSSDTF